MAFQTQQKLVQTKSMVCEMSTLFVCFCFVSVCTAAICVFCQAKLLGEIYISNSLTHETGAPPRLFPSSFRGLRHLSRSYACFVRLVQPVGRSVLREWQQTRLALAKTAALHAYVIYIL